ncbi:hypothetical protein DOTSEDRAFT_68136 [Dothistroma septosporum NZE10]|uniref:C2H2-type domain-containing protein n=1 Tax=Dothistroma septosporum (strain NZE10 / CBS 128990) TaxID=675120 RepID=N1Q1X8_DOTSN|nr:hypothetical protein DOTSEDRAFT_68136 [Dothistroma septosporum NZE10]
MSNEYILDSHLSSAELTYGDVQSPADTVYHDSEWAYADAAFWEPYACQPDSTTFLGSYSPRCGPALASNTPDIWTEFASPVYSVSPDECMSPATPVMETSRSSRSTQRRDRHRCKECDSRFLTASSLETHARDLFHKTFVCSEPGCDKSYCRMDLYTRHKKDHKPSKMHFCDHCPRNRAKSFKRKDHLTQHVRNCHRKLSSFHDASDLNDPRRTLDQESTYSRPFHDSDEDNSSVPRLMGHRRDISSNTDNIFSALDTRNLLHEMMRRQSEQSTVLRRLEQRLEGR